MWKIVLITLVLMAIAMAGLGIRILLEKKGSFSGGSCQATPEGLKEKGIGCGCGANTCASESDKALES